MSERFITPCALPTPHEREILTILIEEAAEVQQRATKMLRFGRDEVQPGQSLTNAQRLSDEIGDLYALIEMAEDIGLSDISRTAEAMILKRGKLQIFMQTLQDHALAAMRAIERKGGER
jgi:hypothetical protein